MKKKEIFVCEISSFGFALNPFSDLGAGLDPRPPHIGAAVLGSLAVLQQEGVEPPGTAWSSLGDTTVTL